ncbi:hypothetical protein [Amycolatopsis pigmentata]|uniref:Endonuclease/Exonuclease/phosphatase family protein n=1 Tax=Amycolatopsis pigmentata TaxID=450801 RepID=A0ABW5G685_9PSEU
MTAIDVCYWNYAHGGRTHANDVGEGGNYNFEPLCRVIGEDDRWPHILILGEADRYDWDGGAGKWGAAAAMRAAGGRPYTPLMCHLPRDWGDFAPAIFVDLQAVEVWRFRQPHQPGYAARRRNVLEARIPGRADVWRVVTGHGDLSGGLQRLLDAQELRPLANPEFPCVIGMDWNSTPSGPQWEHRDLDQYDIAWRRANRILWQHGQAQTGPFRPDTRALDYLCGYWNNGRRDGGIGFHWVAELAGDTTPTNLPTATGRQQATIDGFIVNEPWRDAIVPGSYLVQQLDPQHPESDHCPVRVTIDV